MSKSEQSAPVAVSADDDRLEAMETALRYIVEWADAYLLAVFPAPDDEYLRRAHKVLTAHGIEINRVLASAKRHAITPLKAVAEAALRGEEPP